MKAAQLVLACLLAMTLTSSNVSALTYRELLDISDDNTEDTLEMLNGDVPEDDASEDVDMIVRNLDDEVEDRHIMYLLFKMAGEMIHDEDATGLQDLQGPCSCRKYSCRCCGSQTFHVRVIKKFSKTITVCVEVSYLVKNKGFDVDLQFNGKSVFHKEVSIANPPPLCYGIPGFRWFARICVQFYNVSLSRKSMCVRAVGVLDFKIKKFSVKINIACFTIPLMDKTLIQFIKASQNQTELMEINQLPVMRKADFLELMEEEFADLDLQ